MKIKKDNAKLSFFFHFWAKNRNFNSKTLKDLNEKLIVEKAKNDLKRNFRPFLKVF